MLAGFEEATAAPARQRALTDAQLLTGVAGCGPGLALLVFHHFGSPVGCRGPSKGLNGRTQQNAAWMRYGLPSPVGWAGQSWSDGPCAPCAQPRQPPLLAPGFCADLAYMPPKQAKKEGPRNHREPLLSLESGRQDSNLRPSAPKAPALPSCATPRRCDCSGRERG